MQHILGPAFFSPALCSSVQHVYKCMSFLEAMLTENGRKWQQTISLVVSAISSCLYDIFYSKYKDKLNLIKIVLISQATNVWKLWRTLVVENPALQKYLIFSFFEKRTTFFIIIGYQRIYMYRIVMTYGIRCDYQLCKNMMFEEMNGSTGGLVKT